MPTFIRLVPKPASPSLFVVLILIGISLNLRPLPAQQLEPAIQFAPVEQNGQLLEFPFYGGLDYFIPQFLDIDGDNDLDLFVFSPFRKRMTFLENIGDATMPRFRFVTSRYAGWEIRSWFYFVDIDADGDYDFYQDNNLGGLAFYRNAGTAQIASFVFETNSVTDVAGEAVRIDYTSFPAFADIDADGDYDFFSGNVLGYIEFYQNAGDPDTPAFLFETSAWQNLRIISGGLITPGPAATAAHGANGIVFADFENDGDADLFYGDFFHSGVYFLRNDGTPHNATIVIADSLFPATRPVHTLGFNIPRFADMDGNGAVDFFVACQNQNTNNFIFYQNVGTPAFPQLKIATNNFLTMIDVGSYSAPAFADIDGDGDQDMFIGDFDGRLTFFENNGSAEVPAFRWSTDNFQNTEQAFWLTPAFGDLDADGDLDFLTGTTFGGGVVYFRNLGTPQLPSFVRDNLEIENSAGRSYTVPHLADYDNDGDYDLFLGEQIEGGVTILENTGTRQQPRFQFRQRIKPELPVQYSAPALYDWNRDGLLDLFIGLYEGHILYYEGSATPDSFIFVEPEFAGINVGVHAKPAFVDLNGDGAMDVIVGESAGGLSIYKGIPGSAVAQSRMTPASFELQAYPNPFHTQVRIALRTPLELTEAPTVTIFNLLGARVAEEVMRRSGSGVWTFTWQPASASLAPGVYFIKTNLQGFQQIRKILHVK